MLNLVVLTTIVTSVLSQEIIGLTYTFDEDFVWNFDNKTCQDKTEWDLISYEHWKIPSLNIESPIGIRAKNNSCTSSFPIIFLSDSILELRVYLKVKAFKSGLTAKIFDEVGVPVVKYVYNKSSENFSLGWNTLLIPIHVNLKGYINLIGYCQSNEIVIVDSFRYKINKTNNNRNREKEISFHTHVTDLVEFGSGDEDVDVEGSGDSEQNDSNTTIPENSGNITEPPDLPTNSDFWNTATITIIAAGSFVVISIICITAYHFGKLRGLEQNASIFENMEPARTITIPRVNNIYSNPFSDRFRR
ncbi:unnamed protein product [Parnassius apollo]|uniref:(apollo) hypothetical protein n=1 Tax=Parnassius apollo TaxID=110799 RepID=A0A8S3W429_PARAO|nr:unnamed protein product [Parnassius apollo]